LPQVVVVVVVLAPPDLDLSAPSPLSATGPDREVGGEEILGAEEVGPECYNISHTNVSSTL